MKVSGIIRQDTGVGFYRIGQPTLYIDKISKDKCRITPFTGKGDVYRVGLGQNPNIPAWSDKTLMAIAKDAEVLWSNVIHSEDEIIKMLDLRRWSGAKWVVDIDDNIYNVPPDNAGRKAAETLKPYIEMCLKLADGVTVSAPYLKELYKHLNKNIYVNPNGTDIKFWNKIKPTLHKGIRIGWRGASGHSTDVSLIEPAIKELKKEYDFTFVTFGVKPRIESEHHDWVGCLEYPSVLGALNLDIAVVPLVDSPYNKGKSNIAVQEYSALKIPVVASPVENQLNMPILYAKTNYEWYAQIEKLLKDRKLRQKQGGEQYSYVKKHYSMEKLTPELMSWFKNLPKREDLEPK